MPTGDRFRQQIILHHPAVEPLLVSLGEAFGTVDADRVHEEIGLLAARLDDVGDDPREQLQALGDRVAGAMRPTTAMGRRTDTIEDLLVGHVVQRRSGDELMLAAVCSAVAARQGWDISVAASTERAVLAHPQADEPLVVVPGTRGCQRGDWLIEEDEHLFWCCPHGIADRLLDRLTDRCEELGLLHHALTAAELRLVLPLEARELEARKMRLARVRARLN